MWRNFCWSFRSRWRAIIIPLLILIGLDPSTFKGTVLSAEVAVALVSLYGHKRLGHVKIRLILILLFDVLGAFLGVFIAFFISPGIMKYLMGIYEIIIGFVMLTFKPVKIVDYKIIT